MRTDRQISYVDLGAQYAEERDELLPVLDRVLAGGQMIGGKEIELLEQELAAYHGVKHVVALKSGTDALYLALVGLGIGQGDEVITPPNSFVASTAVVGQAGARPVFTDVLHDQNMDPTRLEVAITPKTKAIMPVHLTGRVADMDAIMEVARRHGLAVIEDSAQAIGARHHGRLSGTFGDVGCFSAHPLKNFNASGDGGFLITNRDDVADTARLLRNHGLVDRNTVARFGFVSRMDTIQAAILRFRLPRLPSIIERRRNNAALYRELLDPEFAYMPPELQHEFIAYHTFVIQVDHREALKAHLAMQGIGTAIHYPIPIHLQPAAAGLGYGKGDFPVCERQAERILTLPIHPGLATDDIRFVARIVNEFFSSKGRAR
jgi:dTDP-4-amino-4,6-dideoxygalactose transaminase